MMQYESQPCGISYRPPSRPWRRGIRTWRHEADDIVTLISAIWYQPVDAKRRPIRRQKSARRQEQEIGLVQPHHLLHGALPSGRGTNEFGPVVPSQHPGEELSATRRAGIDQERQPFLAWCGCASSIQQRAPLAVLVERQGRA